MPRIEHAIDTYRIALDSIATKGDSDAASKVMALLLARDELARALIDEPNQTQAKLIDIFTLDERLKAAAAAIDQAVGRTTLAGWRQSIHPLKSPWWWLLDERAAAAEPGQNPLWTIPAALLFVLSLSVIADTITTLRNGGLNRLSVFGTLMQTVLAIIAGSTFLTSGREWLEQLFAKFKINRQVQGGLRVLVALGLFLLTLGISLLLPYLVARYRNDEGGRLFVAKQYANAAQSYQQAIALDPSYMRDHFMLALAYDLARDYPNAIHEYELSLEFNSNNCSAANNLARLYILETKNYDGALRLVKPFIENLQEMPPESHYHLFKNRGWAYLELHNLEQARDDLMWALTKEDAATAHYLLGRVFEEQGQAADAKAQWNSFIQLATKRQPIAGKDDQFNDEFEPNWVAHAYDELLKGEGK
jgi:tetratricopeptide (TPR) repeat protein